MKIHTRTQRLSLLAVAVAASLQLAACGGGGAGAPDVFPPTVTITAGATGTATGPVTFTFNFSEDVGSSFTADDLTVTGGTMGALTRVSATQYTLVVTPPTGSTGNMTVAVKAAAFSDAAGNMNQVNPTVTQSFNTGAAPAPVTSGSTGACTAAPCINFAEGTVGLVDFGGLGVEVTADPADASNQVAKLTKEAADETWAGVTVHLGGANNTVARIDPAQGISLRVYAPAAGETVMIKIENGADGNINQEALATTTKAGEWETLTFAFPNADASAVYNKVSVFPAFNTQADKVFYIDELKYTEKSSTTPPPAPAANLLANGNFESGNTGWTGNALNVVTEGGNSFNLASVATAGNPWDVNLSYPVSIPTQGVQYKLTFKASSNRSRLLRAGIGLNQDPFTAETHDFTLTTTPQTFERTFTASFASASSRVIFDMGHDTGDVVIDDVVLVQVESATPTPPPSSGAVTFSSGFTSNVLTASGGAIASAGGSNLDGFNCNGTEAWCGSGAGGAGADSFMFFYYQTPSPAADLYSQVEVFGPNVTGFSATEDTAGVNVAGKTQLKFNFNPNEQWFNSATPRLGVVLTLGKRYPIDGGCRLQLHAVTPITALASTAYSLNLQNDFRVAADCGQGIPPTDVAAALAASPVVSSVKFLGAGGGAAIVGRNDVRSTANLSVAAGSVYPTTVALKGAITFD